MLVPKRVIAPDYSAQLQKSLAIAKAGAAAPDAFQQSSMAEYDFAFGSPNVDLALPGGDSIEYLEEGSTPTGTVLLNLGGKAALFRPGDSFVGPFSTAVISTAPLNDSTRNMAGNARFLVCRGGLLHVNRSSNPVPRGAAQVWYQLGVAVDGSGFAIGNGKFAANVGGMSTVGLSRVVGWVRCTNGQTITGGGVDIQIFDDTTLLWIPIIVNQLLPLTTYAAAGIPVDVPFPGACMRMIPSAANPITVSDASTMVDVHLRGM